MAECRGKIEHFTDLDVWRRAHRLFLAVLGDMEQVPRSRVSDILLDQTVRSIGSIGANVSEGFNRSKAKFLNSLHIALGEANETENWLYKMRDACYLSKQQANKHVRECIAIQKMLNGLIRSIRARSDRKRTNN